MTDYKFRDNTAASRYELDLGNGAVAIIDYRIASNGDIALTHTNVPLEYEGQGIGSQLVAKCLEDIRSKGVSVIPMCGFVRNYIKRHPDWEDLVASR